MTSRSFIVVASFLLAAGLLTAWAVLAATGAPSAIAAPPAAASTTRPAGEVHETTILDGQGSFFRWISAKRPAVLVAEDGAAERTPLEGKKIDAKAAGQVTPEPPAKWTDAAFDDSVWPRTTIGRLTNLAFSGDNGIHGAGNPLRALDVGLVALRGKFNVTDPATAALRLSLTFRGGVVVYLNGQEVARGGLPEGAIAAGTPGLPYPSEAFVNAEGKPLPVGDRAKGADKDRIASRNRVLGPVNLPATALRKGVNVLAIELHRSDYDKAFIRYTTDKEYRHTSGAVMWDIAWAPVGIFDLRLAAGGNGAEQNCVRPAGVQVWNQDCNDRTSAADFGDPCEKLGPIILTGARNGLFAGKVVVSSAQAFEGLSAVAGELKAEGGKGSIPASAVEVRYAEPFDARAGRYESLNGAAPAKVELPVGWDKKVIPGSGAVESVWALVRVPADAPAGDYAGALAVSAGGEKLADVPIKLHVADWKLPDPKEFQTFVGVYSSPITLALKYKVEQWSQEHWKLMDRSMELLGQLGTQMVHIPVGDQAYYLEDSPMVTFVKKEDGSLAPDFSIAERYLKLVKQHLGVPKFVVADVYFSRGWTATGPKQEGVTVTVLDKKTGKTEHMQVPELGTEEGKKFWSPVLLGLKERLAKEGMDKSLCLGCLTDTGISQPEAKMFADILGGDVQWQRQGHGAGGSIEQPEPLRGSGQIVAHYYTYLVSLPDPKTATVSVSKIYWPRIGYYRWIFDPAPVMCLREFPAWARFRGHPGFGLLGLDYWNVDGPGRGSWRAENAYPGALSPHAITWAGPKGAEPLTSFQALREGLQEMEAMLVLSVALDKNNAALGPELAGRCRQALTDSLIYAIDRPITLYQTILYQTNHYGWQELSQRIYALAGEVAAKTGAN